MAACSSLDRNYTQCESLPKSTGISVLPSELILHIMSFLADPHDLANATVTCKKWHKIATDYEVWTTKVRRMGIPAYHSKFKHLTELQVAKMIGPAMKNIMRIRDHIMLLTDLIYEPISEFLATAGLPVDEKGVIPKKMPEIILTGEGKASYKDDLKYRITLVRQLKLNSTDRNIIFQMDEMGEIARKNLNLTNKFLQNTLYEEFHSDSNLVIYELVKHSRRDFLCFTTLILRSYFDELRQRNLSRFKIREHEIRRNF